MSWGLIKVAGAQSWNMVWISGCGLHFIATVMSKAKGGII